MAARATYHLQRHRFAEEEGTPGPSRQLGCGTGFGLDVIACIEGFYDFSPRRSPRLATNPWESGLRGCGRSLPFCGLADIGYPDTTSTQVLQTWQDNCLATRGLRDTPARQVAPKVIAGFGVSRNYAFQVAAEL